MAMIVTWKRTLLLPALVLVALLAPTLVTAEGERQQERSTALNFDEQVVEGVNKRAFDSFAQVSEKNKKGRKVRLYRTRQSFSEDTRVLLREIEVNP